VADRRRRRRWKRALGLASTLTAAALVTLVLLLEHRPNWYRPADLDDLGLERARRQSVNFVDEVSGRMVAGQPFDLILAERSVNEWLFAILHHRPELRARIPPVLTAPSLGFRDGTLLLSALWDTGRWRAILTVELAMEGPYGDEYFKVSLRRAYVGSLPVPGFLLERLIAESIRDAYGGRYPSLPGSSKLSRQTEVFRWTPDDATEATIRNRFVWPNGDRAFRLDRIQSAKGEMLFLVEPLP
jgi:hypothetical protein